MTAAAPALLPRGKYQGTLQIVQYNWPFYAATAVVSALGLGAVTLLAAPPALRILVMLGVGAALFWSVSSLAVSYYVYDRSGLYRWGWISAWFPDTPRRWANIHAGLDESSPTLRALFPSSQSVILDIFDAKTMTEPSIVRARRLTPPVIAATPVTCTALPFPEGAWDTVFLLFAAHELRDPDVRLRFFQELHRVLAPRGRILLVEHLRDLPNMLAFGPGFLHFLPRREWLRVAREGGFTVVRQEAYTPFIGTLLLEKLEKLEKDA